MDQPPISAEIPDWSREARRTWSWTPSQALLASLRDYQKYVQQPGLIAWLRRRFAVVRYRFWSVVTGADIPLTCKIGGGLMMPHPNGIVIHPDTTIGPNCLIFQQVTLAAGRHGAPAIGGHVDIGAGAKILGAVRIGNHAAIGANALIVFDVPDGAVVMAPLARITRTVEGPVSVPSCDAQKDVGSDSA